MRALYDSKTKTMYDYGIRELLDSNQKYQSWLDVEAALATAQGELGIIPQRAAKNINEAARIENIDLEEMERLKESVGHGFVPFLKVFIKACHEESGKYVHYGVTTQNIQQTAQLLVTSKIHDRIMNVLADILSHLGELAKKHKNTVMSGRTHGRHAIPITYGYKVSVWISETIDSIERLSEAAKRTLQVMMGGAVGSFNTFGEKGITLQSEVAKLLNMNTMPVPSRNITSHKTEYIHALALLANGFHKIAEEVYSTSIEEIGEVSESFESGTIGSSTMPHKINPKLSKGIIANAQKLYTLPQLCLNAAARPYEADSSQYMVFDAALEEAIELITEVVLRTEELTKRISVHVNKMKENASLNKGLDNSEFIMMELAKKLGKDKAHTVVYNKAIQVQTEGSSFVDALLEDKDVNQMFSKDEIKGMLLPERYVGAGNIIAEEQAKRAFRISEKIKKDLPEQDA
ncbi:class-II fumarase/aspartase family protein [Oceanobacillus oncorhynchi]|uniref:class-II fumarase/aspartase family protein n=1 Tax=Oceanobacillus oncorhynchi TaxID=545501 RepID=UPI002116D141|nr:adenylosuccinate lyase family protein [Oceanobacillus oncorhynchi]UUI40800.1 adenylosuccinate lyase family protein [Oceanobacillus oncorhynchi]